MKKQWQATIHRAGGYTILPPEDTETLAVASVVAYLENPGVYGYKSMEVRRIEVAEKMLPIPKRAPAVVTA